MIWLIFLRLWESLPSKWWVQNFHLLLSGFFSGHFILYFYTSVFQIHLSFPDFYWVNCIKIFNYIYFPLALSCTNKISIFPPHKRPVWYHILDFWLVSSKPYFLLQHTGDHLTLVQDCSHQKKEEIPPSFWVCPQAPNHNHFLSLL